MIDSSCKAQVTSLPQDYPNGSRTHKYRKRAAGQEHTGDWYCSEPRLACNKIVVTRYRILPEQRHYVPPTINLRLAAVRRLAYEAADCGLLSPDLAADIRRVKSARRLGGRIGNSGPLSRAINKAGRVWGNSFTPKAIWSIVKEGAVNCGLVGLAPHDLRRTCARLCHQAGGELEQISPWTRFHRNHRTVSWLQAAFSKCRECDQARSKRFL